MDLSNTHTMVPANDHGHGHGHGGHGDVRSYVIGFVLAVVLTALPFGLVMSGALAHDMVAPVCMAFAAVQIVVHLVYFLHMNSQSARTWNGAAMAFTVIILLILVVGTLWVMVHMNMNMMPGMTPGE